MEIKHGLSSKCVEQLIDYSNNDEEVKKFTSDAKRFKDIESYQEWLKKGRQIYSLVDEGGNLMGITWFGYEGDGFTLAIRTYARARHRGYSYDFLRETMNDFMKSETYERSESKDWWLETSIDNSSAINLYEKLGFVRAEMGKDEGKIIFRRRPGFVS